MPFTRAGVFCLDRVGRVGNTAEAVIFWDDLDFGRGVSEELISFLKRNRQNIPEDMPEYFGRW